VALYIASIRKQFLNASFGVDSWVNTYHVTAVDDEGALSIAAGIVDIEKAVHWSHIAFTQLAVRQDSELAGSGRQIALTGVGERDATDEHFLPSFCTVRVTFTDGVNRPDQKYLRLPINETEQSDGTLDGGLPAFVLANYVDPLMAYVGLVSSNGATYTSGTVQGGVQMRQRDWKRRSRPGFKRGYVPV